MTTADIVTHRLINQQLVLNKFQKPDEIIGWLGAMQAQEYAMAKWAIGLRSTGLTDAAVEAAFNDGTILRTHLLRPTWHFVAPADIRWMLALTAPRVRAVNAYTYRKFELDSAVLKRSNDTLANALQGGNQLTREQLKAALARAGIVADGTRLVCLLMQAELDGIVCSGPRRGKQFTYALLNERVPPTRPFDREEALAELTRRYFTSRGPATLSDFVWWSGLTMKDVRAGVAMLGPDFVQKVVDGQSYVFAPTDLATHPGTGQTAWLLPNYDEYGISYKDRTAFFHPSATAAESLSQKMAFDRLLILNGMVVGSWKRTLKPNAVDVETAFFALLDEQKQEAVKSAIHRYASFLAASVTKSNSSSIT